MGLLLRRLGYDVADVEPLGAEQLSADAQEAHGHRRRGQGR